MTEIRRDMHRGVICPQLDTDQPDRRFPIKEPSVQMAQILRKLGFRGPEIPISPGEDSGQYLELEQIGMFSFAATESGQEKVNQLRCKARKLNYVIFNDFSLQLPTDVKEQF